MKLDFDLKITKVDIIAMVLLAVVFFSIAAPNLGSTKTPITTVQLADGQSFYVDVGSSVSVKSMFVLLKGGALNFTVYSGSPGNWQSVGVHAAWPYNSQQWSEDYYKWHEINLNTNTQYLKVDVGQAGNYPTIIAEVAVIGQNNQPIEIKTISNAGAGSPDFHNLIDEQNLVVYTTDYTTNTYFDEIYFVRTAEQYLHLQMPYEWTHPPLGKLIQAAGILVFGFDPFGWRIVGVIFATFMIPLLYLLGKKMFGTWIGGFAAAFLLTFDFMHFTMARLGTADTYVIFFSLASQLFFFIYFKNVVEKGWKTSTIPLIFSILFFGLSFSTKWLVLYGFVGELLLLIAMKLVDIKQLKGTIADKIYYFFDKPYSTIVFFGLAALGIYFLTYIPDMLAGRSPYEVIILQGQMYQYHSTLTATHPFSSPWYSWPFLFDAVNNGVHVPLWLEAATLPNGLQSTIVILGNPAVWWVGFGALIGLLVFYLPRKLLKGFSLKENAPLVFLIVVFFFQWVPYVFISRVVFIYHFYTNVPILCLVSAFFISKYWSKNWVKALTFVFFALVVALFVLFYPVISGVPTSSSTINSLKWFGSWVF